MTKQYIALVGAEDVSLSFQDDALERLAEIAFQINEEVENIGSQEVTHGHEQAAKRDSFESSSTTSRAECQDRDEIRLLVEGEACRTGQKQRPQSLYFINSGQFL